MTTAIGVRASPVCSEVVADTEREAGPHACAAQVHAAFQIHAPAAGQVQPHARVGKSTWDEPAVTTRQEGDARTTTQVGPQWTILSHQESRQAKSGWS